MANRIKPAFLDELARRFGRLRKLGDSQSLYEVGDTGARVYIRYSKVHARNQTFYGLRETDLRVLEGHVSFLCFLWDGQEEYLLVPYCDFEEVFRAATPADDGQYKVQVFLQDDGAELYVAGAGRFNVEGFFGWNCFEDAVHTSSLIVPELSHSQVQTLLGAIGSKKGYEIWVPADDRAKMDWSIATPFPFGSALPLELSAIARIVEGIDLIWIERGAGVARAFFEVEHSTSVYSGLLRFNDVHLVVPNLGAKYTVVSNDERRSLFVRQLSRPTFTVSGLHKLCSFLEYRNVFGWHVRMSL